MGKNKQQVPRLRFPGFNDAWEQRKFKELVFLRSETVESQDYSVDIELENLESNTGRIIGNTSVRTMSNTLFKKGDILFGKLRPYLNKWRFADEEGVKSGEIWAFSCREGYSNRFIYCVIQSNGFLDEVNITSGTKMPRADWKTVSNIKITIPTIEEQTTIGNFFRQLDAAIASHQRKLERTNKLKKSLLQKMFPKDGEAFPELRFPDFTDAWEQRKLNEISQKVTEKNVNNIYQETFTNSAEFGIINQRDFFDKDISNKANLAGYYVVQNNDFVYNPRISNFAPVGPIKRNKLGRNGVMSPLYYVFRVDSVDYQFLETYFENTQWHIFMKENGDNGARSDRFAIKDSVFSTMPILLPSQQEQTAIGNFFRQLDEAIASHQRKLERVKELKKSLLQKMFPKDGEAFPELRFPNFTDAWEQRKLGEVAERVTRKNTEMISKLPLTISAQYGLIAQTEFFDKQIASKNISGYYLIKNGEFAYNKSYSNGYPWGAVKRLNNYDYGVLSTLYIVFKPTNINSQFLVSYYDTNYWHNQVASIAVEGARNHGLLNISASEFFTTTLAIPKSIQEQTAIGDFFRQLDAAIASHQRKLEHMQALKKGLLQQMFV